MELYPVFEVLSRVGANLSNREKAWLVWTIVLLALFLSKKSLRKAGAQVFTSLFAKAFLKLYVAVSIYLGAFVYALNYFELWSDATTKDFTFWLFGAGLPLLFGVTSLRMRSDFKPLVWKAITLTVLLEFIVGLYTFSFIAELILAPILFLVLLMKGYLEVYPDKDPDGLVYRALNFILSTVGVSVLVYLCYSLYVAPHQLFSIQAAISFSLPIVLTIFYLPFIYCLSLFVLYEGIFVRLPYLFKEKKLRRRVWWQTLWIANMDINKVSAISGNIIRDKPTSKHDSYQKLLNMSKMTDK